MIPLNLRALFGDRDVISRDREAAESPRDRSPWLYQIKTRVGVVCPRARPKPWPQSRPPKDGHTPVPERATRPAHWLRLMSL